MASGFTLSIRHIDTCTSQYLNDHHQRDGEVLLGVAVDGATTARTVLLSLPDAWQEAGTRLPEAEHASVDALFTTEQQEMLAAAEQSGQADRLVAPEAAIDDESDPAFNAYTEPVQAWYLVTFAPLDATTGAEA